MPFVNHVSCMQKSCINATSVLNGGGKKVALLQLQSLKGYTVSGKWLISE